MTREEALERIEFRVRRFCPEANGDNIGECNGCWRYPCNDMKAVELLAQERPHGEWIRNDNGTYSCSVCKSWIPNEQHYYARYCLHCGRIMRENGERE